MDICLANVLKVAVVEEAVVVAVEVAVIAIATTAGKMVKLFGCLFFKLICFNDRF